jgi:CubicO group peptidase (beta-lactamase class C family)
VDVGLDPETLRELVVEIREGSQFPDLHGLLIVRNGALVVEEYFAGYGQDDLHSIQSVTKSVTSALIGIALERGHLRGLDERIVDFFPQWRDTIAQDPRRAALTLRDLLTMRSGTDYHEDGNNSPHDQLNRLRRGWDRFYLSRTMIADPGTRFRYDSGGVILMSSLLKGRAGVHAHEFAPEHLFKPLGITRTRWFVNDEGHPHTGGGLHLHPRDMARFGFLYLQRGHWNGRQVVPEQWVEESTRLHVPLENMGYIVGYGYLWWILQPDPDGDGSEHIYAAMGFRAQYIFVVPEHEMVVVVTGGTRSQRDQIQPVLFLYSHILPAVQRDMR